VGRKKISKNSLNRQIKEGFLELWKNQMKQYSEGKLRTYTTFKVHFGFENYLSVIGNFEHRRCLTKLRISAHRLHMLENFEVYVGEIRTMVICFDYIVVLNVHKHIVVKEIFLDIQVDSNSGKYFL
jgi:hypothetical protein